MTDTPMTELQAIAGEAAVFAYIESQAKACKEERRDWVASRMREQGIRGTVDGKAMGQIVGAVTVNGSKRKIGITNHAEFVAYAAQHHADALRLPYQYERALLDKLTDHDGTFIDRAGTVVPGVDWVETTGTSSASANKDTCPILVRGMLSNGRVSLDLKAVES